MTCIAAKHRAVASEIDDNKIDGKSYCITKKYEVSGDALLIICKCTSNKMYTDLHQTPPSQALVFFLIFRQLTH